jgi:hypothetical protein
MIEKRVLPVNERLCPLHQCTENFLELGGKDLFVCQTSGNTISVTINYRFEREKSELAYVPLHSYDILVSQYPYTIS